jgi:hypothetical protein
MAVPNDLASSNVNRSYSLSATSIAIFTFTLVFLYPRFAAGELNSLVFQATLAEMALATFALGVAAVQYYGSSLPDRIDERTRQQYARRGDALWTIGYMLLYLSPSLILFSVGLDVVGAFWFGLWLVSLVWALRDARRMWSKPPSPPPNA